MNGGIEHVGKRRVVKQATSDAILITRIIAYRRQMGVERGDRITFSWQNDRHALGEILEESKRCNRDLSMECFKRARHLLTYHENGLHVEIGRSTRI